MCPGLVSCVLCLGVGVAVHCSALSRLRLPASLGRLGGLLLGWLHSAPPPAPAQPMGATLEVQRTQHAEAVEQQLLRARARQFNVVTTRNLANIFSPIQQIFSPQPIGGRQMRLDELWRGAQQQPGPPPQRAAVQPSPALVQALTDMGFPRQRVEAALVRTNNDMDHATNMLLNDM